jgi:hypothetical protein
MGKPVKVPDPVYQRVTSEAERRDVPRGVVVADWMEKADKYEEMERRGR